MKRSSIESMKVNERKKKTEMKMKSKKRKLIFSKAYVEIFSKKKKEIPLSQSREKAS